MIRVGSRSQGYTIIETILFLTVTGILFVGTVRLLSGQQGKTEFSQAIRDVQSQLQDVTNDVSTGFYHSPDTYTCTAPSGIPLLATGYHAQGTNEKCIFIGRAIQFAPTGFPAPERIATYNIVGLRLTATGAETSKYDEAIPTAIARGTGVTYSSFPDAIQTINMPNGLTTFRVQSINSGLATNLAGFGLISSLARYSLVGSITAGSLSIDVVALAGSPALLPSATSPALATTAFADNIDNLGAGTRIAPDYPGTSYPIINPDGGLIMCFNSATSNQHAVITLGKDKKLTPIVAIRSGFASIDHSAGDRCI